MNLQNIEMNEELMSKLDEYRREIEALKQIEKSAEEKFTGRIQ